MSKYEEAIEQYDLAINLQSSYSSSANFQKGIAYTNLKRFDEAIDSYKNAIV